MATVDSASPLILPRPGAARRLPGRRSIPAAPATARGALVRRRGSKPEAAAPSGERVDTWILQGAIWLTMAGMTVWFHAPLGQALRSIF
jgi:hypothetical protein